MHDCRSKVHDCRCKVHDCSSKVHECGEFVNNGNEVQNCGGNVHVRVSDLYACSSMKFLRYYWCTVYVVLLWQEGASLHK